jgi:ELWxxDGT repeat protein
MTVFQDKLIFEYAGDEHGWQLWSFNGQGVARLTDYPGGNHQGIHSALVEFKNELYFVPWDNDHGQELWRFDGTKAELAVDVVAGQIGSTPHHLTVWRDALYFEADGRLWRYDGESNTEVAKLVNSNGRRFDIEHEAALIPFGDNLYFLAYTNGRQLWRFDGNEIQVIHNLEDVRSIIVRASEDLMILGAKGNREGRKGVIGSELWAYDGSSFVQITKEDFERSGVRWAFNFAEFQGDVYFTGPTPFAGNELWMYDGARVSLVADINQRPDETWSLLGRTFPGSSSPRSFFEFRGKLYFSADDGLHGRELWVFDPAALPEPSSTLLLASGLAVSLVAGLRRPHFCVRR